eukprot:COSAG01_NODE_8634_length_2713_cov_1.980107_3_plen_86_part_00
MRGILKEHFVANSMEKSCDGGHCYGREDFDASVSVRDLMDTYLPPFQACVERGDSAGLMCSYSACSVCARHRVPCGQIRSPRANC